MTPMVEWYALSYSVERSRLEKQKSILFLFLWWFFTAESVILKNRHLKKQTRRIHMNEVYDKLMNCYKSVREKTDFVPEAALVLGSGLGDYADHIQVVTEINYSDIEGFPVSTVVGHAGKFIFGYVGKVPVVCMKGRVHYYEGYPVSDVVLPTRLMKLLGAKILFLSNASGGMNRKFQAGDLMMITDHIGIFAPNPLIGANIEELGTRFPDMSHVYDLELQELIRTTAKENNIPLQEGVYVQLTGPSYESPAEIRMLADYADAVGMSTVVEAIAANHCGLRVCGISCVCNLAAGMNPTPLSHKEVQEAADKAAPLFTELVTKVIEKIGAIK
jgi:purine-nucleoside phosphorylase